jgi:hypothetical protein
MRKIARRLGAVLLVIATTVGASGTAAQAVPLPSQYIQYAAWIHTANADGGRHVTSTGGSTYRIWSQ